MRAGEEREGGWPAQWRQAKEDAGVSWESVLPKSVKRPSYSGTQSSSTRKQPARNQRDLKSAFSPTLTKA